MNILDAIFTRRSVRKFTGAPISDEIIQTILRAAMAAPSAGNEQPWRFVVITDKNLLQRIPAAQPHARMAVKSACTILACGDLRADKYPASPFWVQDVAAAMQNMLLTVHSLGLGACWCGVYPKPEWMRGMAELCNLPEYIQPLGICVIGHPVTMPQPEDRFEARHIHYNLWESQ